MIRQSETVAPEQTQVTAQQYQAAVTPRVEAQSGLSKLIEFGQQAYHTKWVHDQEVLQADMHIATEKFEDAVKKIPMEEFVKDPDAHLKSAGIDELYKYVDQAPLGNQELMRKQIDYLRDSTKTAIQQTYAVKEHARATVFNVTQEVQSGGTISPEHWAQVNALPKESQTQAISSMAQVAITSGNLALFEQMKKDANLDPSLRPKIEQWERQTQTRIHNMQREQEQDARRARKDAEKAHKESLKTMANNAAIQLIANGYPIDYAVKQFDGTNSHKVEAAIRSNPNLYFAAAKSSVLSGDRALVGSLFNTTLTTDGVNFTPAAKTALKTLEMYDASRGGDTKALEGSLLTEDQAILVDTAKLTKVPDEPLDQAILKQIKFKTSYRPNPDKKKIASYDEDALDSLEGNNQMFDQYKRYQQAYLRNGATEEIASEKALERAKTDTMKAGDFIIGGKSTINSIYKERLGAYYDEDQVSTYAQRAIENVINHASKQYYGKATPMSEWSVVAQEGGNLFVKSLGHENIILPITEDDFRNAAKKESKRIQGYSPKKWHVLGDGGFDASHGELQDTIATLQRNKSK
ncbi:hypothetical protein [Aeromonas veronii]|uniref:hypothetical protein n=1 Tax=Aeromonas veronii TaxID=654 RepID=UPI003B9E5CA0